MISETVATSETTKAPITKELRKVGVVEVPEVQDFVEARTKTEEEKAKEAEERAEFICGIIALIIIIVVLAVGGSVGFDLGFGKKK